MAYYETPYPIQKTRKRIYGALLALWGIAVITGAVWFQGIPYDTGLWLAFAATFLDSRHSSRPRPGRWRYCRDGRTRAHPDR